MKHFFVLIILSMLTACAANTSGRDSANEHFEKQVAEYGEVTGVYEGVVTPPVDTGLSAPFPVQIQLYTITVSKDGVPMVKLAGNYKRLDFEYSDQTDRFLDVSYRNEQSPAELYMSSSGGTPQIPNAFFMTLNGYLQGGVYTANFYDRRGFIGVLKVKKIR